MYAIIKTGAKQYKVQPGDALNVEKLDGKVGDKVEFEAIFTSDGGKIVADASDASKTKVTAKIVEQFKDKKVIVFKFKKRKNYQRKVGHRQPLTRIFILSVGDEKAPEKKATKKATGAKKDAVAVDKKQKDTKSVAKGEVKATKSTTKAKSEKKDDVKESAKKATPKAAESKKASSSAKKEAKDEKKVAEKKEDSK